MLLIRNLAWVAIVLLCACGGNETSPANEIKRKAITGATLIDGTGRLPIPNALVVVENDKILVATGSTGITIPDGAEKFDASGLFITPAEAGGRLEYGAPANLFLIRGNPLDNPLLLGSPTRIMRAGEWTDARKN